jgi:diguanylate cyclase (GGDEF)-like protein
MKTDSINRLPDSALKGFSREAAMENLGRIRFTIPLVLLTEIVLCFSFGSCPFLNWLPSSILIFHAVCIPLSYILYLKRGSIHSTFVHIFQAVFSLTALFFASNSVSWPTGDGLYFFIIVITVLCIYWFPLERIILLSLPYGYYVVLALKSSVSLERLVLVTIFTCCVWVLGQLLFSMKKNIFLKTQRLEQSNKKMKQLMQKDEMTELLTHNTVFSRLGEEILRSRRIGYPLTLMMIDIDDFKKVNDTFGHLTGDEVIRAAAHTLLDTARETDIIGRYGGDEFMIIMPDTDAQGAHIFSQRLEHSIARLALPGGVRITFSGGYCQHTRESLNEFIQKADEYLYKAKASGKNQFVGGII